MIASISSGQIPGSCTNRIEGALSPSVQMRSCAGVPFEARCVRRPDKSCLQAHAASTWRLPALHLSRLAAPSSSATKCEAKLVAVTSHRSPVDRPAPVELLHIPGGALICRLRSAIDVTQVHQRMCSLLRKPLNAECLVPLFSCLPLGIS